MLWSTLLTVLVCCTINGSSAGSLSSQRSSKRDNEAATSQPQRYFHPFDMSLSDFFYDPFSAFGEFNSLFDEALNFHSGLRRAARDGSRMYSPRLDLNEGRGNTMTAQLELPGLKKEDVQIELVDNRLIISGETRMDTSLDEDGYVMRERRYGKFSRSILVPAGTEPEQVTARVVDGILTVTFPKAGPEHSSKKIIVS